MIAHFLSNISAKYYKILSMLCRVIAKNVGDVFFETQCIYGTYLLTYKSLRSIKQIFAFKWGALFRK